MSALVKRNKLQWFGHVIRCTILQGETDVSRKKGRPAKSWIDNIIARAMGHRLLITWVRFTVGTCHLTCVARVLGVSWGVWISAPSLTRIVHGLEKQIALYLTLCFWRKKCKINPYSLSASFWCHVSTFAYCLFCHKIL